MSDPLSYFDAVPGLWSWSQLLLALTPDSANQNASLADETAISRVVTDSRLVEAGDLFVALSGDPGPRFNPGYRSQVDGHSYVGAAFAAGASGAVVHEHFEAPEGVPESRLLRVEDTYDGLWALGKAGRNRLQGTVVALTGSSGKTTAKTFLQHALQAYAPPGSFNNHIGVPLALANAPADAQYCVFEIGTNHPGEILPLAEMVRPHWAILLNVHQAHIENFLNWEDLKKEKISIFNALEKKSHKVYEDELNLQGGASFGFSAANELQILDVQGNRARFRLRDSELDVRVPGGGQHRALTTAAVVLTCALIGDEASVSRATSLPESLIPAGRGRITAVGERMIVDDSYNANPQSMQAALIAGLQHEHKGPRIAVVGEMLELGDAGPQSHMGLIPALEQYDQVYCIGEGLRKAAQQLGADWSAKADDRLLRELTRSAADALILIKGSNRIFWAVEFVQNLLAQLSGETNESISQIR